MSDSDDDWFTKDEEEIVQSLQQHVKRQEQDETEHIECRNEVENHLKQLSLEASAVDVGSISTGRFSIGEFTNALKKPAIEMFIYFMSEVRDLFLDQLKPNDSQKRLMQLLEIIKILCQLELGGFDEYFLSRFAEQAVLMDMVKRFILRLLTNTKKAKWDSETETLLKDMKWLMIRAHKLGVLRKKDYDIVALFKKLVAEWPMPEEFKYDLSSELEAFDTVFGNAKDEIYPTLERLLSSPDYSNDTVNPASNNVADYLNRQRLRLCNDFSISLMEFVQRLQAKIDIKSLELQGLLWPNTRLVQNAEIATTLRHGLISVDIRPEENNKTKPLNPIEREFVENIKTGSLLCFTSNYDFENLLLATVMYTPPEELKQGYLNVEIAKQYNIGNIYEKALIMFETPVFFEPYLRVHNYLSTCSADKFPMRHYIVNRVLKSRPPTYINSDSRLVYNGISFEVERKIPKEIPVNAVQQKALKSALNNEFVLIQGPPGTGKTHVSVELVNILIQNAKRLKTGPIIVLTYTNESLDKFLLKVAKHTTQIVRFGSQSRDPQISKFNARGLVNAELIPPRLKRVWWLVSCQYKERFQHLQTLQNNFDGTESSYQEILQEHLSLQQVAERLNTLQVIFQYYVARDKDLLAMTTTCGARLNFLFRLLQSKCFLFEEAAEIQEAHILACLTPYTEHVIQIGDHKQLQPFTGTNMLPQISMFERLINDGFPVTVLNEQYRMRPNIAQLLVPSFYDELLCSDSVHSYKSIRCINKNLFFVHHNQHEHRLSDMSIENQYEAVEFAKLIHFLIHVGKYKTTDIVVLSPYNAQVERIKQTLPKSLRSAIKVATVDSYQGLEANIVLLSLVRSNSAGQIGFLSQPNRVCVALSRARWALYIMGDINTLQEGNRKLWNRIYQQLKDEDSIGEAFPLNENEVRIE